MTIEQIREQLSVHPKKMLYSQMDIIKEFPVLEKPISPKYGDSSSRDVSESLKYPNNEKVDQSSSSKGSDILNLGYLAISYAKKGVETDPGKLMQKLDSNYQKMYSRYNKRLTFYHDAKCGRYCFVNDRFVVEHPDTKELFDAGSAAELLGDSIDLLLSRNEVPAHQRLASRL